MKSYAIFPTFNGQYNVAMNNSILTTSPWKPFLAFVTGVVLSEILALAIAKFFSWDLSYGPYPTLKYGLISTVLCAYPYLVCRALSRRSATGLNAHRQILKIYLLAVINNALSVYYTEVYGVAWLVVLITVLINAYCLVKVFSIPARELKSIVLDRSAHPAEYMREFLQFMFWPLYVWWLQPTLTSVAMDKMDGAS